MNNYANLKNFLKDQASHGLPNVLFTDNAGLRSSIARLSMVSDENMEVSVENITDVIQEYEQLDRNKPDFGSVFDEFQAIADAFANKLSTGVENLKGVKSDVETLKDKFQETVAMRIAEDPVLAQICGIERTLSIEDVAWKYLDAVDTRYLVTELHDSVHHDPDHEVTPSLISMIINKIPGANASNAVTLNPIKLDKEVFNRCVDTLQNYIPEETREFVAGMLYNVLALSSYDCAQAVKSATNLMNGSTLDKLNHMVHVAYAYQRMFDAVNNVDLDLSESSMTELRKHLDIMRTISNTILYIANYYRNIVWKDSVLLPGPVANTDTMDDFVREGGTTTRLVQHYKKFYADMKIPVKGISGKFILQSAERLENEVSAEAAKSLENINKEEKRIKRGSFIVTSVEYLRTKKLDPKFSNVASLERYAAAVFDSLGDSPIESCFYKLIMNSMYPNTITSMLYDRISNEYVSYAAKIGKLSKETCEELDEKVYADMISEYMVDQGILVV